MKEDVLKTLDFENYTVKELASEVRKSGLYPADKIIERMDHLFENKNIEFEHLSGLMQFVEEENGDLDEENDKLKKENEELEVEKNQLENLNVQLKGQNEKLRNFFFRGRN